MGLEKMGCFFLLEKAPLLVISLDWYYIYSYVDSRFFWRNSYFVIHTPLMVFSISLNCISLGQKNYTCGQQDLSNRRQICS